MLLIKYTEQSTSVALTTMLAQGVKVKRHAPVGKVSLYLKKIGSPEGYLQIEVWSDSDGPDRIIANGDSDGVPCSLLTTDYDWVDFEFDDDSRPEIWSTKNYHIVLKASDDYSYSSGVTEVVWGCDQDSPHYAWGEGQTYDGATWSDISPNTDFCFKVYSKDRSVYSSISDVEAIIKNHTDGGVLTHESTVTVTKAMDFEEMVSNEIDLWLSGAGFSTPVTDDNVIAMLRSYAVAGTALYCELTQPTSGFRGEHGADTRTGGFRTLYYSLRRDLEQGGGLVDALVSLGLSYSDVWDSGSGLTAGGIEYDEHEDWIDDDTLIKPKFELDMWENN